MAIIIPANASQPDQSSLPSPAACSGGTGGGVDNDPPDICSARVSGGGGVALDRLGVGLELSLLQLCGSLHRPLHLGTHVRHGDDDEAGLARIEMLAQV